LLIAICQKSIAAWKSPLFAPYFHQTGFLHCVSGEAPEKAVGTLDRFQASAEGHETIKPHVVPIKDTKDVRTACWQLDGGFRKISDSTFGDAAVGAVLIELFVYCGKAFRVVVYRAEPRDSR
jgi:hypothetical protein